MKILSTDLIFKMEHQFTLFLQRAGVKREDLPPDQLSEMRKAFYGGLGQMFFLITQDVVKVKGEKYQAECLASMQNQIGKFWEEEVQRYNSKTFKIHPNTAVRCSCGWQGVVSELDRPASTNGLCKCPRCDSTQLEYKRLLR